jgi:hypothetical protein
MELELPLQTSAAPPLNDLEASLSEANPISSRMIAEVTAAAAAPAPASSPSPSKAGPVRRPSMELELSLPTLDSDPPAPPRESAPIGGAPLDLADALPRLDAAPMPLTPIGVQKAPAPAGATVERPQPVQHKIQVRLSDRPPDSGQRLKAPVAILLSALVVALADYAYHRSTGGQLALGPIRAFWIAAPLALVGVGFMLWRLMEGHVDDE